MCIFSQAVKLVADTSIFARRVNGRQVLVYGMRYSAAGDLAMVLPIPVPPDPHEDAVTFINLERYPEFFADMRRGFRDRGSLSFLSIPVEAATLKVHEVGAFEASFVPGMRDFGRLDERFRLPANVWNEIPSYGDYGFVVFKLKSTGARAAQVHPMAFEFPQREPELLFFPTVHVHDGNVQANASFDHMLYCQLSPDMYEHLAHWQGSRTVASAFIDIKRAGVVLNGDQPCWRRALNGWFTNTDTWVGPRGSMPQPAAV